jgi:hypothetical protein
MTSPAFLPIPVFNLDAKRIKPPSLYTCGATPSPCLSAGFDYKLNCGVDRDDRSKANDDCCQHPY